MDEALDDSERVPLKEGMSNDNTDPVQNGVAAAAHHAPDNAAGEVVSKEPEESRPEDESVIAGSDKTALDIDRSLSQPTSSVYAESSYQPLLSSSVPPTPQKPPRSTLSRKASSKSGTSTTPVTSTPAATPAAAWSAEAHFDSEPSDKSHGKAALSFPEPHFSKKDALPPKRSRSSRLAFFKNKWILIGVLSVIFLILILVIVGISVTRRPRPPVQRPEIKAVTRCGFVLGTKEDDVYVFKGIPYVRPPVGENRWRYSSLEPELADCFADNYPAYEFKSSCVQAADYSKDSATSGSEDCLYLNIWTPSLPRNNKIDDVNATGDAGLKPVFVYFHGGFLRHGSGNASPTMPTPALAKELDAVVVSFNYRLNVFGFLSLKTLQDDTQNSFGSGNYGLWDQIVALRWISDNIRGFGGNPNMVTVGGLDGGATSIYALFASPFARRLFHRAWLSGGAARFPVTQEQADRSGSELLVVRDCKKECLDQGNITQCKMADCLRAKDVNAAWSLYTYFAVRSTESDMQIPLSSDESPPPPTSVVVDGRVIAADPSSVLADLEIPLLIGTNSHETDYAVDPPQVVKATCQFLEQYLRTPGLSKGFNVSRVEELTRLYPCSQTDPKESSSSVYIQMATDIRSTCPYNKLAEAAGSRRGPQALPVYRYVSTVAPSEPSDLFRVRHQSEFPTHGFEVVTFFGNSDSRSEGDHLRYQSTVRGIVRAFIHGRDLTTEYNMTSDGRRANVLAKGGHITVLEQAYGAERCRFWNSGAFQNSGWSH